MCKKVRNLVYSDSRIQKEEIAQALGISYESVSTILHDRLSMRKLTVGWVPKSLSDEQMTTRASVCSALLKRFRSKDDFLLGLVTVDKTWVHYYGCWLFRVLRPFEAVFQSISGRLPKRGRKRKESIDESKNVQTTPTRTYCKCSRPLPYCNPNCRTPGSIIVSQRIKLRVVSG